MICCPNLVANEMLAYIALMRAVDIPVWDEAAPQHLLDNPYGAVPRMELTPLPLIGFNINGPYRWSGLGASATSRNWVVLCVMITHLVMYLYA